MGLDPDVALFGDIQGKFGNRLIVGRLDDEERVVLTQQCIEILYFRVMPLEELPQCIESGRGSA